MIPIKAIPGKLLALGVRGENKARQVMFPIGDWVTEFGTGTAAVYHKRNGDESSYPVTVTAEDGVVIWPLTSTDTDKAGYGSVELQYVVGDVVVKTSVWQTMVTDCLSASGDAPEPGTDWEASITLIKNAAETAQAAAEQAKADAEAAQSAAETAQAAAEQAKADAEAAETTATQNAGDAATSAADALTYKEAAETAKIAAEAAQTAAETAKAAADSAQEAAESAQTVAEAAKADAEVAQSAAETAEGNAQTYASSAGNYASAALTAKQTAVSAKDASVAAKVSAEGAASAAITAKNAAETAKAAAETAKEAAETAQTAAEAAQMAAETAKTDSIEAKTAAETAAANALTYKEAAETAKTAAEAAQAAAEAIDPYTKAESDNRFYPLAQCEAKKSGSIVTIDDALPNQGIKVKMYGKTVQERAPSTEAPVPFKNSLDAQSGAIVQLKRCGKNLFNVSSNQTITAYLGTTDGVPMWMYSSGSMSLRMPVCAGATYTVHTNSTVTINRVGFVASDVTPVGATSVLTLGNFVNNTDNTPITATAPSGAQYMVVQFNSANYNEAILTLQIEVGSTTAYEPYTEQTCDISAIGALGAVGDVADYCEITDAQATVHHLTALINSYNGESITTDYISSTGALTTGATVRYVLPTPIVGEPITLSSAISILDGTTNIFAQNTDIAPQLEVTYRQNLLKKIDELATAIVALGGTI